MTRLLISLIVVAMVTSVSGAEEKSPVENVSKLTVEEFDHKRKEKDVVVIDVRTPAEFKAGHVPGAVNIDIGDKDFEKKVEALDKDKTYVVHCQRGGRSARAVEKMKSKVDKLFDFTGGMHAWQQAGKPVEK
jgi:rhodanese-related sulfurtransferase